MEKIQSQSCLENPRIWGNFTIPRKWKTRPFPSSLLSIWCLFLLPMLLLSPSLYPWLHSVFLHLPVVFSTDPASGSKATLCFSHPEHYTRFQMKTLKFLVPSQSCRHLHFFPISSHLCFCFSCSSLSLFSLVVLLSNQNLSIYIAVIFWGLSKCQARKIKMSCFFFLFFLLLFFSFFYRS